MDPSWVGDVVKFSEPEYLAEVANSSEETIVIKDGVSDVGERCCEKEVCVGVSPC